MDVRKVALVLAVLVFGALMALPYATYQEGKHGAKLYEVLTKMIFTAIGVAGATAGILALWVVG